MSRKPVASQAEFDRLVEVLEAVPFGNPGATLHEVLRAISDPYGPPTLAGILATQISRGLLAVEGRGENRRYRRVVLHVRATLAELIDVV